MTSKFQTLDGKSLQASDINTNTFTGIEIHKDGAKFYFKNGKLHREDGPAYIGPNGNYEWRHEGQIHRLGEAALRFYYSKTKFVAKTEKKYYYIFGTGCSKEQHDMLYDIMKLKGLTK